MAETPVRHYPAARAAKMLLVFAHGAGAGHDHPFMTGYATALAVAGVDVVTFNFPYMDAGRRMPDRAPVLESRFRDAVDAARTVSGLGEHALFIGGKSMGGRMATHLAAQELRGLRGTVAFGYPLHPPGKPTQLRVEHLPAVRTPLLVVQGERDVFGTPAELEPFLSRVPGVAMVHTVQGGDHSLGVRGMAPGQVRTGVVSIVTCWMADLVAERG
jgi:predicted alpha/beta-hydrolase family hydrolase